MNRQIAGATSEVKNRKAHYDLEAEIDRLIHDDIGPDGTVYPARYRHRAAARRHLLMDGQSKFLRRQYHRAVRRNARQLIADQLEEMEQARFERDMEWDDDYYQWDDDYWYNEDDWADHDGQLNSDQLIEVFEEDEWDHIANQLEKV